MGTLHVLKGGNMEGSLMGDYHAAFTRIGNALGLGGVFGVHFGYEQIEQRAKAMAEHVSNLERLLP